MSSRRESVLDFFRGLCEDYDVYRFLPHVAMNVYDSIDTEPGLDGFDPRARVGTYFLLAQKSVDTQIIRIDDMASACLCEAEEIKRCEVASWLAILSHDVCLGVERAFHRKLSDVGCDDVKLAYRYFDASLSFPHALETRISAVLLVLQQTGHIERRAPLPSSQEILFCSARIASRVDVDLVLPSPPPPTSVGAVVVPTSAAPPAISLLDLFAAPVQA